MPGVEVGLNRALRIWCHPKPPEALAAKVKVGGAENTGLEAVVEDAVRLGLEGGALLLSRRANGNVVDSKRLKE